MKLLTKSHLTKSLQSISHGLVLHHVYQPTSQAEVREDQEDIFQNVIDATDLLQQNRVFSMCVKTEHLSGLL